jgi:hypothetical protein
LLLLSQGNCEEQSSTRALRASMCSHGSFGGSAQAGCPRNARQTLTSRLEDAILVHTCSELEVDDTEQSIHTINSEGSHAQVS